MLAFGAGDPSSNLGRTTISKSGLMKQYFVSRNGTITETDAYQKNSLIALTDPSEEELRDLASQFSIDISKLMAATDIEEPSRWEQEDDGTYLIIDVPFRDEYGNFDTVPLMLVLREDAIIALCEKSTGILKRFMNKPGKGADLENKVQFELRLLHAVIKEYQQDLKEIDIKRRTVEKKIKEGTADDDVSLLHDLENSLVYFITSLKGCNAILELMRTNGIDNADEELSRLFETVRIENIQAVEMATVYKEILNSTRDLLSTEINLKLNVTMKTLTVITIILTIPMIVTGAYGMNVDVPLQDKTWAFAAISCGTILFTGIIGFILRKKHIF